MITCLVPSVAITLCLFPLVSSERGRYDVPEELAVYNSFDKLLDYFRNENDPLAKEILETFLTDCAHPVVRQRAGNTVMRPVIVIEGNHRSSRDIIASGLAEMMNARYLIHPAPCIYRHHGRIPKGTFLRRAFFLLSDYAVSFYAKAHSNRPIIINGYWTEKIAFALAQCYTNDTLPQITSDVFKWPKELLKPDFIFYLNFPQSLLPRHVTTRSPVRWKKRMSEMFEYMQVRHPIVIKDIKSLFKLTTEEIHRHVREHFYDKVHKIKRYFRAVTNATLT